jgi:bifunctional non-homologous end joining protein LigD
LPTGPSTKTDSRKSNLQLPTRRDYLAAKPGAVGDFPFDGAEQVLVWDSGTYEAATDMEEGLRKGLLKFTLAGDRLHGGFSLVRLKRGATGKEWLLTKD